VTGVRPGEHLAGRAGPPAGEYPAARSLRALLLAILTIGVIGTLAELYLLEHYEEWWQRAPVTLLALSIPVIGWCWMAPSAGAVRVLQLLMFLFVLGGLIGLYQHYSGNAEFELEMYPSRAGFELFWESLKGATPALAPGALSWLGLVGLAYAFRHPALERRHA
jgi:uncharacterized membrane protein